MGNAPAGRTGVREPTEFTTMRELKQFCGVRDLAQFIDCDLEEVIVGLEAAAAHETLLLHAPPFTTVLAQEPAPAAEPDPHVAQLEQFVDPAQIFASAQDLSKRERLVLYLTFQETRSQADIARRLGVPEGCVATMIHDALPRLRARGDDCAAA